MAKPPRSRRNGAITLVEVMIALAIILLALLGLLSAISYTTRQNAINRENESAHRAAEVKMEELRAVSYDAIFTTYRNASAARTALNKFWVEGIDPESQRPPAAGVPTQAQIDSWSGWVLFPGDAATLVESTTDAELGMPRDLNGNGSPPESVGYTNGYTLLPIRIRIQWRGISGSRTLDYNHLLLKK